MDAAQQWWSVEQVAVFLGVNQETVRRWLRSGALKGAMIGGARLGYRVARADLDAFIQLRKGADLDAYATRTVDKRRPGPRPAPSPDLGA